MQLYSRVFGQGKPFIILHGFLGMGDNWKTLGKKFSEQGFEIHLVDQRNHGKSFHSSEFNYDVLVEDLKTYCLQKKLENIILLGHSMGGKTAMLFATQYPEIVSKLIVADISPKSYPIHHDEILNGLSALDFNNIKTRNEANTKLSHYVPDFGTRQFLLKNVYRTDEQLALRINLEVLKANVSEIGNALPKQSRFLKSTLFLKGEKSNYITTNDADLIHHHFPLAKVVTISNAGHWLHAENPKQFFDKVVAFL